MEVQEEQKCPTSGIYGGYGTKLTDIKLFLYANNVTAGTVKLNKPQLEVGTIATDWRPNPSEQQVPLILLEQDEKIKELEKKLSLLLKE